MSKQGDLVLDHADVYVDRARYHRRCHAQSMQPDVDPVGDTQGFRAGHYLRDGLLNQAGLAGFIIRRADVISVPNPSCKVLPVDHTLHCHDQGISTPIVRNTLHSPGHLLSVSL